MQPPIHAGEAGQSSFAAKGFLADRTAKRTITLAPKAPQSETLMSSAAEIYSPGLEGVIAGETAICTVEGGLSYRGYAVGDLAEHCTFDEVAFLLLHGELPGAARLKEFSTGVAAARRLPPPLKDLLAALPK